MILAQPQPFLFIKISKRSALTPVFVSMESLQPLAMKKNLHAKKTLTKTQEARKEALHKGLKEVAGGAQGREEGGDADLEEAPTLSAALRPEHREATGQAVGVFEWKKNPKFRTNQNGLAWWTFSQMPSSSQGLPKTIGRCPCKNP